MMKATLLTLLGHLNLIINKIKIKKEEAKDEDENTFLYKEKL